MTVENTSNTFISLMPASTPSAGWIRPMDYEASFLLGGSVVRWMGSSGRLSKEMRGRAGDVVCGGSEVNVVGGERRSRGHIH